MRIGGFLQAWKFGLLASLLLSLALPAGAAELPFRVQDIRVEGLQRVPVDQVFRTLPIQAGDRVDAADVREAVERLYGTGDFEDVRLGRDGDVLVVEVSERPSIASIEIEGNKSIDDKKLREGLSDAGLEEGEVYQRSTLENITGELKRQYISQGRYGAQVEIKAKPLSRNRVALTIDIYEGKPAKIRDINIVGNEVFSDEKLLDQFELRPSGFWTFFGSKDKYSRERLSGDLESLRSFYLDRGYINFSIESNQVSVTADRREVYITINVVEGEQFKVRDVNLAGDLVVDEEELRPLLLLEKGETFSQQRVTYTSELLTRRLGNEGYTFAEVEGRPEENEDGETVDVTFYVNPGNRVYVNRIEFNGNTKTRDEVLRRELRQFEGAPANSALIDLSRRRLQRLGYFSRVQADTNRLPGDEDKVDIEYEVEEQPSGSIGANIGYSQANGVQFGANVSQKNFMGTGDSVSFSVNRSRVRDSYSFSHRDPYYTLDGVSRGFSLYYTEIDFDETSISSYATERAGGSVSFGYPLSETARVSFGAGLEQIDITTGGFVATDIELFLRERGFRFDQVKANASWRESTMNRGILPDRGWSQNLRVEGAVAGSDYNYFKATWEGDRYYPLIGNWTLRSQGEVGFGDGYGDDRVLPFFENYFAGGIGSVRGYESRSLGPRSDAWAYRDQNPPQRDPDPDPIGGNMLVEGSLELIFPTPFAADSRSVRTFFFADAGNVFQTEIQNNLFEPSTDELRYSAGIGLSWLTAIGPLGFSLARPIDDKPGDDTEVFQFSLGQSF